MAADGSVIIDTRLDTTGVQKGVSAIKQSFNGLGSAVKKIGLLIGGAFAVGKLVQFGKECVELGSDLAEVQNVVDVTFTTMSGKVNEFAKNAMTSAGLSETMAKRYVGTFGAMSKSFGFSEAQAYDMSTALTQLTGDVASFYNISQDLAYIKLKSVFTGETETLKDLGVVLTQSALDQYALANGYGKTTSAMTEQEKVALRLAFVQKQLSAASGDFIRTSDSWANQVRVMQLQLQSLKATVGQGLINIFTPVLKVINILLGKLATLANAFKSFTELITGKKSSGQTSGSGAGLTGDASGVRDACETIGIGMNLTMSHGDIIIRSIPDNMTFRQLFGYAAMVESANARIDYSGNLGFIKWDFEKADIPDLKNYGNPPVLSSDDIIITGIRVKNGQSNDDTDSEYSGMYGKEGYLLELENELIDSDQLETVASIIGEQIVGARFRNLEGDLVYNPLIEFGDMVYTYDRLGNSSVMDLFLEPLCPHFKITDNLHFSTSSPSGVGLSNSSATSL